MRDRAEPRLPGKVLEITSLANPRIKAIRSLALAKFRKETGLFLGEGLKLVTDALARDWPIDAVIHATELGTQDAVQKAAAMARARGADILSVSEAVLSKLTRRDNPQMVVGVFRQQVGGLVLKPGKSGVIVALEGAKDPGNLGTIIRTVDAVGADGVVLVGPTVDPFSIEAVRATMGSLFHVPIARMSEADFLAARANWPGIVVGTHLHATADFRTVSYDRPVLIVMGNEQSGLTARLSAACDHLVHIPMAGQADSLNLAVATGLMLYEVRRAALPVNPPAG